MNNRYGSVVPANMTNRELLHMCMELQTAKNWGLKQIYVTVPNKILPEIVEVTSLPIYRDAYRTETKRPTQ